MKKVTPAPFGNGGANYTRPAVGNNKGTN